MSRRNRNPSGFNLGKLKITNTATNNKFFVAPKSDELPLALNDTVYLAPGAPRNQGLSNPVPNADVAEAYASLYNRYQRGLNTFPEFVALESIDGQDFEVSYFPSNQSVDGYWRTRKYVGETIVREVETTVRGSINYSNWQPPQLPIIPGFNFTVNLPGTEDFTFNVIDWSGVPPELITTILQNNYGFVLEEGSITGTYDLPFNDEDLISTYPAPTIRAPTDPIILNMPGETSGGGFVAGTYNCTGDAVLDFGSSDLKLEAPTVESKEYEASTVCSGSGCEIGMVYLPSKDEENEDPDESEDPDFGNPEDPCYEFRKKVYELRKENVATMPYGLFIFPTKYEELEDGGIINLELGSVTGWDLKYTLETVSPEEEE